MPVPAAYAFASYGPLPRRDMSRSDQAALKEREKADEGLDPPGPTGDGLHDGTTAGGAGAVASTATRRLAPTHTRVTAATPATAVTTAAHPAPFSP